MFTQTKLMLDSSILKFFYNRNIMDERATFFQDESKTTNSLLAKKMFAVEGANEARGVLE